MKPRILVVDDEETMRATLADILTLEGYQVDAIGEGEAALEALKGKAYDLMILDLKMPGMDGVEVMRRSTVISPETRIILLTAHGSLESAIEALRQEASDYLLKPVTTQELLASVADGISRWPRRRSEQPPSIPEVAASEEYPGSIALMGDVLVDLNRREISQGDLRVGLTPMEGKLLSVLLAHRGRVLSHRELVFQVQGYEVSDWEAPEVLRPQVSRLRKKLANFGGQTWIVNVRGAGYFFESPVMD